MKCTKCGGEMKPGKAIQQTWEPGTPDFPGQTIGVTMHVGGPGVLIDCLKCSVCGRSITLPKDERFEK